MEFIKLVAETFNHLAWPMITLVYPLYASVGAIESNLLDNNRKWLTYWVLCVLIMLFELISAGFIEWLPFWPHIKLVITFWLVIPYFGGAVYAYDRLVKPCLNLNPQLIGNWLRSKQVDSTIHSSPDFLLLVERYVQEKGSEALEELIFGKAKCVEPSQFAEKNNSLASVNEKEVEAVKRIKLIESSLAQTECREVAVADDKSMIKADSVSGGSEFPGSSTPNKDQKEWTCDLCQVCTPSEAVLQNHFQGKKHKAKVKAKEKELADSAHARMDNMADTNTETKPAAEAEVSGGVCEWPELPSKCKTQKEWTCALCQVCTQSEDSLHKHLQGETHMAKEKELVESTLARNKKNAVAATENKPTLVAEAVGGVSERPGSSSSSSSTLDKTQEWSCALCQLYFGSEVSLQSHLHGKEHKAKEKKLIESTSAQIGNKIIVAMDGNLTTEDQVADNVSERPGSSSSSSSSIPNKNREWTCALCQLCVGSEASLQCHLHGKKHKAKEKKLIESASAQTDNKVIVAMDNKPTTEAQAVDGVSEYPGSSSAVPVLTQDSTCDLSQLRVPNEVTPQTHDQVMKHEGDKLVEFTCAQDDHTTVASTENKPKATPAGEAEVEGGVCELPGSSSSIPEKANHWTCDICQLSITNEASLYYHLQGKKHKAKEKKLMESALVQPDQDKADSATVDKSTPETEVTRDVCEGRKSPTTADKTQEWSCTLCQFYTASETTLWYHLHGKMHEAKEKELMAKQTEAENKTPSALNSRNMDNPKAMPMKHTATTVPKSKFIYVKKSENIAVGGSRIGDQCEQTNPNIAVGGSRIGDQCEQTNMNMEPRIKLSALWCEYCKLQCNSSSMLADHLRGKRHLKKTGARGTNCLNTILGQD